MPVRPFAAAVALLTVAVSLTGCVKKSTHETVLDELARSRASRQDLQAEMEERIERCEAQVSAQVAAREETEAELARTLDMLDDARDQAREMEARFEEARTEVHRLEVVMSQRGTEYQRLEQRLRSLASIEQEVRQRNQIYEEVLARFRGLIDAGRLSVVIDRGRMVIQLPQDILFPSGSATLGADGRSTLTEVASVLADLDDRRFQVEGHTDDVPIATERFPSNWELSTARALSVVRLLADRGVPPANLSGAGYGEFQPVADNGDAEGRRRNRRIEIVMLPNLDVIAAAQLPGGGE